MTNELKELIKKAGKALDEAQAARSEVIDYLEKSKAEIDKIENEIFSSADKEIPTSTIGEIVMENLKELHEVAYVRFASIYREFKDVNTFMSEIKKILEK